MGGGWGRGKKGEKRNLSIFPKFGLLFLYSREGLIDVDSEIGFVKTCCVVPDTHTVWHHGREEGRRLEDGWRHDARSDIQRSIHVSNILNVIVIHMHELRCSEVYIYMFFRLQLIAIRIKIIVFIGNLSK